MKPMIYPIKYPENYHIHTDFSDGKNKPEDYVKAAIERKFGEIGFSDHIALSNLWYVESWTMKLEMLQNYIRSINRLKEKYPQIAIRLGVEMDYIPGKRDQIKEIVENSNFDYVIGSVHLVGDFLTDSHHFVEKWKKMTDDEIVDMNKRYYEMVQEAANSKLFNIIGHFDVVKKYNFRPQENMDDVIKKTLDIIKNADLCIEVNTSGLEKPCHEIYPSEKILKWCHDLGIPLTLGTDAHNVSQIDMHLNDAIKLIKSIGYKEIATFDQGKIKMVVL